ncbi:hypothetical protein ACB098_10G126500 [Castanea mollissima]
MANLSLTLGPLIFLTGSQAMATLSHTLPSASALPILQPKTFTSNSIKCCENQRETVKLSNNGLATFPEKNTLPSSAAATVRPPRPRRIILVRHGQSEGNLDETAYTRIADPKIALTEKGMAEAEECGLEIREMIEQDKIENWKVYFYVSPYRRTLETLKSLARGFERSRIAGMRVEPRLREQDFGNFQDREKMRHEKAIRMLYGRFFYRFPNGESAADVYDRITGFRETLRSDIDIGRFQPPGDRNPEQFEQLNNLGNGKIIVMEKGYGGRYSLLMHHSEEELRDFGLSDDMLMDQDWQKFARPGELNYDCPMMNSFFTHFADEGCKT